MNRYGFTLIELLGCLVLMGIVLALGIYVSKDTLGATVETLNKVSDSEVYDAARTYVISEQIKFNDLGYTCITVSELVDYGFLEEVNDSEIKNKIVKVDRNNDTKVITSIEYVSNCG